MSLDIKAHSKRVMMSKNRRSQLVQIIDVIEVIKDHPEGVRISIVEREANLSGWTLNKLLEGCKIGNLITDETTNRHERTIKLTENGILFYRTCKNFSEECEKLGIDIGLLK